MNTKILIVTKSVDGGTGTFVKSLSQVKKYLNSGSDIQIVALEKPSFRKIHTKPEIKYLRRKKHYPEIYKITPRGILDFFEERAWIKKEINSFNPDVVIGIDIHCNLLIESIRLSKNSFESILTTHIDLKRTLEDKSTPLANFALKSLAKFFYSQANTNICVSRGLKNDMKAYFGLKNVKYIYNGLRVKISSKPKNPPKDNFTFITYARLFEQKDHKTLLEAFSNIKRKGTKLFVGSDGPLRKELASYSKKLGVSDRVTFLGWTKNKSKHLKKADAFVLSSKREGFGYVLIEAMQYGLPIVSTDTKYGPKEILDNGNYGLLVPVGNVPKMRNAMEKLMSDKAIYQSLSKKALERSKYFSEEKMLRNYARIIDKLT
jgi:N-acetylgalactosamine-N,N'-diacetylbacillosaminyl-diphospho-undecaprenol 4-alpha-N-acetylgalactosaminyltransferase